MGQFSVDGPLPRTIESSSALEDGYQRRFRYLRLSLTQTCNFRCTYCLPEGSACDRAKSELSLPEIILLVRALAELGVTKVRLTGGEPTTRPDFIEIARAAAAVPGITDLALTTNGYRLSRLAPELQAAGVKSINVSVDSLRRERFREITGQDRLEEILRGIDRVLELGFARVKMNVVLLKGWNDDEVADFLAWTARAPVCVRFIELMPTGANSELFKERYLPAEAIRRTLSTAGWSAVERSIESQGEAGPAQEWTHPEHRGTVGIIAPYSRGFCESCNRLRVTSEGALRLCLFGEADYPLRALLQSEEQRQELKATIQALLQGKRAAHLLHEGKFGNVRDLAKIGG